MSSLDNENKNRHSLSSDYVVFVTAKRSFQVDRRRATAKCEMRKKKTKKKIKRNKTNNHIQSVQSFFFYLLANSANLSVQC